MEEIFAEFYFCDIGLLCKNDENAIFLQKPDTIKTQ